MEKRLKAVNHSLVGEIEVPGDKSISHRAVMFGSMAHGVTHVRHFLDGEDCMRTVKAFQAMGVSINKQGDELKIDGRGITNLKKPTEELDFGNSGTTARLMLGVLAGMKFNSTVYGDASLTKRPMDRVVNPLKIMGAKIDGAESGSYLPLTITGQPLIGIDYSLPVKSAQVKSAVLLAGLQAEGETIVRESNLTRNHTETMLQAFGASIKTEGLKTTVTNEKMLQGTDVYVPGDISSAAFFIVASAIVPGSKLTLKRVGLNHTRTGILDVIQKMGVRINILNEQMLGGESFGDIIVEAGELRSVTIEGDLIPRLIDEIPVLALLATQAEGTTVIKNAEELRVKETDRITAVTNVLNGLGASVEATADGMLIHGKTQLKGGKATSYNDHRIAMMSAIASLITEEDVIIDDISSIAISYPSFFEDLQRIK
ncbi:3-phosphoshikimate 1-carboxyvinyltransferase 1 [Oceanobacillus picturae]|uniref:3-phosphoshikimate 1-carboxyvinyltransferase n=1 Tax=Oceanobacillus picturae TaxID=171693 RepID=A0A0U9H4B7_9BACI|nr:3-phosphoshikimate 1-carboxyvinyltransferase [Oceanobacillus picturae]GAQ17442.1 3-phosphoshikimate 1-carboxyvinyltransferase 1 [Oceanobacillus picturae]